MIKYTILYTKGFDLEVAKLSPEDRAKVMKKIAVLENNPFYPSLRTKKIKQLYESSVNMDIRMIWRFDEENRMVIVMLDVGHHDVLKKY